MKPDKSIDRRTYVKTVGSAGALSLLAGCQGGGDGGDGSDGSDGSGGAEVHSLEYNWASSFGGEDSWGWDSAAPTGTWELSRRLDEKSDGNIKRNVVNEAQICGDTNCSEYVTNDIVKAGNASLANSSAYWPATNVWTIPYTFPDVQSAIYSLTAEETWEQFWIPLAKKRGVLPTFMSQAALRQLYLSSEVEREVRHPDDLEGLRIRRTLSATSERSIRNWGATPIEMPMPDALQGMETGAVDGVEVWNTAICGFGIEQFFDQVININWGIGTSITWSRVDWLKSLNQPTRELLSSTQRAVTEELMKKTYTEAVPEKVGVANPPPEGSRFDEAGLTVQMIEGEEREPWEDRVSYENNPDMWSDIISPAEEVMGNGIYDNLLETARSDSVPDEFEFEFEGWWTDYIDRL
jgi:TRAP-type C4-dicarboxylate transport system substrate-binding protein